MMKSILFFTVFLFLTPLAFAETEPEPEPDLDQYQDQCSKTFTALEVAKAENRLLSEQIDEGANIDSERLREKQQSWEVVNLELFKRAIKKCGDNLEIRRSLINRFGTVLGLRHIHNTDSSVMD